MERTSDTPGNGPPDGARMIVRGVWKVFGPAAGPDVAEKFGDMSKAEVQDGTGSVVALRDVNFDVYEGETFVVMGLSGSGKSTLVRCLTRLIEPTVGEIVIDGEDVLAYSDGELTQFRRRKTGMVFQYFGLLPHRTVVENVAWGLEVQGVPEGDRLKRANELLEAVGLSGWGTYHPRALSGGMQQRVGVARALASDPEILLMDEPFSALDPLIRRDMQNELVRLQRQMRKTIIFITHDLSEALKLGDRIAIMRDGEVVQVGTGQEILARPADDYVAEFVRDVRKSAVVTLRTLRRPVPVRLFAEMSPVQAMDVLREHGEDVGFVVDGSGMYVGATGLAALAEARAQDYRDCTEALLDSVVPLSEDMSVPAALKVVRHGTGPQPLIDAMGRLTGQVSPREVALVMGRESLGQTEESTASTNEAIAGSVPQQSVIEASPIAHESRHGLRQWVSALPSAYVYGGGLAVLLAITLVFVGLGKTGLEFPSNFFGISESVGGSCTDGATPKNLGRASSECVDTAIFWITREGSFIFRAIKDVVQEVLLTLEGIFLWVPWPVLIGAVMLLALRLTGWRLALFSALTLLSIGAIGLWHSSMETLALITVAVTISVGIAVPMGIVVSRSDTLEGMLRPLLDAMQTMPSFVYLVPVMLFFGVGNVAAIFATVVYAVAPAIRLTNLGIRQVTPQVVEAARSFGTTPRQLLFKVQLPMAVPTIMAGINQTTMMALSMVVIAGLVGAGGLGNDVNRALGRLEPGKALFGGIGIVVLAIIIDRLTQASARKRQEALAGGR